MGTKKISELQELETLSNNDLVAVVDTANEATKKMTAKKLGAATGVPTNAIIGYDGDTIPVGYEEVGDTSAWQNATLNSNYVSSGKVNYKVIGDIVFLRVYDLILSNDVSDGTVLATGLPLKPYISFMVHQYTSDKTLRLRIPDNTGRLEVNYDTETASSAQWYGEIFY